MNKTSILFSFTFTFTSGRVNFNKYYKSSISHKAYLKYKKVKVRSIIMNLTYLLRYTNLFLLMGIAKKDDTIIALA